MRPHTGTTRAVNIEDTSQTHTVVKNARAGPPFFSGERERELFSGVSGSSMRDGSLAQGSPRCSTGGAGGGTHSTIGDLPKDLLKARVGESYGLA